MHRKPGKKLPLLSLMARRSLLPKLIAVLLALFTLYSLSHIPFPSPPLPLFTPPPSFSPPVKVYLYELPVKFTYGVIESYHLSRNPNPNLGEKVAYPGHQHSAEWYLFADLINPNPTFNRPIVRVSDPAQADLFYVPFFSSLSLIVNQVHPVESPTVSYSDEQMQEELMDWIESQDWWKRNKGRDHVVICQDPNALYKVMDRIKNAVLLVSDFGRLKEDQASLVKDVVLPYSHRINPYKGEIGVEGRKSLLFFMGNRYRKEGGKIRDTLFQILESEPDVVIKHGAQSRESRRLATQGMHSSRFCLHPAGDTPSACRLFDAIVSLCVPVVVSDFVELPFESAIEYVKIAVFVRTEEAVRKGALVRVLRGVGEERVLEYQREIQKVKHYFEYENPNGTVNEIWRQVSSKLPLIKLMINRDKRLVRRGVNTTDCSCVCSSKLDETLN